MGAIERTSKPNKMTHAKTEVTKSHGMSFSCCLIGVWNIFNKSITAQSTLYETCLHGNDKRLQVNNS